MIKSKTAFAGGLNDFLSAIRLFACLA